MSEVGSLAERLKERERLQNEEMMKIVAESSRSLRDDLTDLLRQERTTTEAAIKSEAERLIFNTRRLFSVSLRSSLLVGIATLLGVAIGSSGLIWYLSRTVRQQLEQIQTNKFVLTHQEEALKKGYFVQSPKDGKLYVRIEPESAFDDVSGRSWGVLLTR